MIKIRRSSVQEWLKYHQEYNKRSMLYVGTLKYLRERFPTAEGAEYIQLAVLVHRRFQDCVINDEKGKVLDAQYRFDEGYVSKEQLQSGVIMVNGEARKVVNL